MKRRPIRSFEITVSRLRSYCYWLETYNNEAVKLHSPKVYLSLFWLPNLQPSDPIVRSARCFSTHMVCKSMERMG
jgi:hypothetical protein